MHFRKFAKKIVDIELRLFFPTFYLFFNHFLIIKKNLISRNWKYTHAILNTYYKIYNILK